MRDLQEAEIPIVTVVHHLQEIEVFKAKSHLVIDLINDRYLLHVIKIILCLHLAFLQEYCIHQEIQNFLIQDFQEIVKIYQ